MSLTIAKNEIFRFLASSNPEVLCLRGRWGIGKTFGWNQYLQEAKRLKNGIALSRYSYVSLFGINSLEELRFAVFENSLGTEDIGTEPDLETLQKNPLFGIKYIGKKSVSFLQQIPFIKNHIGNVGPFWFLSVKNMVICIDDVERAGKNLSIRDVLGFVSHLKDRKG